MTKNQWEHDFYWNAITWCISVAVHVVRQVSDMQKELELLQPQLVVAATENEKMLAVIERESRDVETKSERVRGEEALANEQAAASQALKEECEADLAEAIPALNAALAALDTLKVNTATATCIYYVSSGFIQHHSE